MITIRVRIYLFTRLPWSFRVVLGTLLGSSLPKSLWCASTKLCFRTLEFSLAPSVLIPARSSSDFTLPRLAPSVVTKCNHFSLGPFFVTSLSFSGQKAVFIALFGYQFFPRTVLNYQWHTMKSLENTGSQQFISCVSHSSELVKWGVTLFMAKSGCHDLWSEMLFLPHGMPCWHPRSHPLCVAVRCLVIGG